MNILVVEDDRDIREMLCQSLVRNEFRTTRRCSMREARHSLTTIEADCMVID